VLKQQNFNSFITKEKKWVKLKKKILHCRRFEKKSVFKKLNCKDGKEVIHNFVLFPILKKFDEKKFAKNKNGICSRR